MARKGENYGGKEGGKPIGRTMMAWKGENYGGKEGGKLRGRTMVVRKGENYGGKEGVGLWWQGRGGLWWQGRRRTVVARKGEDWWQGRGRTMVARKGENYGGKSSQSFVYRPVALYKEGGELWWQGRGRTKGGGYSGVTHVARYGSRCLNAGHEFILTHHPVYFQCGMTGKPAEQAKI